MKFANGIPDDIASNLAMLDDLGGPKTYNHYPNGWAMAFNTPFKMWNRDADNFVADKARTLRLGCGAETGQQAHIVKPAFIAVAEAASGQIANLKPREPRLDLVRRPNFGCCPQAALHLGQFSQEPRAFGTVGKEEIAVFLQAQ